MENPETHQSSELGLNGFEKIFVQVATDDGAEQSLNTKEQSLNIREKDGEHVHSVHSVDAESFEVVTMAEAARRLNMPYPTLRRHVLNGKIQSVTGEDGKPLVKLNINEYSKNAAEQPPNNDEQSANIREQTALSSELSLNIQTLLEELKAEREYSRVLATKLEAASHRNGYLEAVAEQQSGQIKLLTDGQHNSSLWNRFFRWFVGTKP